MKNVAPPASESTAISASKNEDAAAKTPPLTYAACNMLVTVYDPAPGQYTLAMGTATGYKKFGLPNFSGTLDFQNIDYLTFEFSKQYADAANTVKLYRIRRSDGKYLTLYLNPTYDTRKLPGNGEEQQLWIMNDLGNNKYNLLAPKLASCFLARTYTDTNGIDKLGILASGQSSYSGSVTIYIHPAASVPPSTN
jgi:hypothetical protein